MTDHFKASHVVTYLFLIVLPGLPAAERKARLEQSKAPATSENPAATTSVRAPVMGFLTHSNPPELRPIYGLPGAAQAGDPLVLPPGTTSLAVAPGQNFALVESNEGTAISAMTISETGAGAPIPIPGALSHADQIAFGPSGSTGLLFNHDLQRLQIISGLPSAGAVSSEFILSWLRAPVTALAVSDDGQAALVGTSMDEGGTVVSLARDGTPRLVASVGHPTAIRFLSQRLDALVSDGSLNQIVMIADVIGTPAVNILSNSAQGVNAPVDLQVSDDLLKVLVLNSGNNSILTLEISSGLTTSLPLVFSPSGIGRLAAKSLFAITDSDTGILWVTTATTPESRVWFVPTAY